MAERQGTDDLYLKINTICLDDKVDCTGDDHRWVSSDMACHKTTLMLHTSSARVSPSYS